MRIHLGNIAMWIAIMTIVIAIANCTAITHRSDNDVIITKLNLTIKK